MSEAGPRGSDAFNHDVCQHGGYVYTTNPRLSSRLATDRRVELVSRFGRLADGRADGLGCVDGTFTSRYVERCGPRSMSGLDGGDSAIEIARNRPGGREIDYQVGETETLPWDDDTF